MTCIVGLVDKGKVYIGADSAGVGGYDLRVRTDKKVFKVGDMVFGFTTSFRMGQLLQFSLKLPERDPRTDVFEYMTTAFVNAVRDTLKDGGFAKKNDERESGGTFLVGYGGRLFTIEGDYQVAEDAVPYAACGCGDGYALGSLYSTKKLVPRSRIKMALQAAESFSAGVCGPFNILDV